MDGYAASHRAVAKLKEVGTVPRRVRVRSCKYLNNENHRRIKQRIRPMLGFRRFETAAVTIRGIELTEKIKKQQFYLKPLTRKAATCSANLGSSVGSIKLGKPFVRRIISSYYIQLYKFALEPERTHISKLGRVCQAGAPTNPLPLQAPTSQTSSQGPSEARACRFQRSLEVASLITGRRGIHRRSMSTQ